MVSAPDERWKMNLRISPLPSLLLIAGILASVQVSAGTPRIVLLADVQVRAADILLADLLPTDVPSAIRNAAVATRIGSAPQIGAVRRLSRDAVLAAISAAALPLASFDVPESTTVRRTGSAPARRAIFDAIATAFAKDPSSSSLIRDLQPENLIYDPSVDLTSSVAALSA